MHAFNVLLLVGLLAGATAEPRPGDPLAAGDGAETPAGSPAEPVPPESESAESPILSRPDHGDNDAPADQGPEIASKPLVYYFGVRFTMAVKTSMPVAAPGPFANFTVLDPIGFDRLPQWIRRFRFPDYGPSNSPSFDPFDQSYWWE